MLRASTSKQKDGRGISHAYIGTLVPASQRESVWESQPIWVDAAEAV